MRLPGESHRPWLSAACILLLLLASAGCGGSSSADTARYEGVWLRIEAGEPNPDFTLTIVGTEDGADVTFAEHANGMSQTVPATTADGALACTLPAGGSPPPGEAPPGEASAGEAVPSPGAVGAPVASELRLSLDQSGRLVVDVVLPDGTLEPVWVYDRAVSTTAEP